MAAQLPGARARPTGKLAPQTFQGLSLYLMASEAQLWALETTVFLTLRLFMKKLTGCSHGLTGLLWLPPGHARGTLECMTSGPW